MRLLRKRKAPSSNEVLCTRSWLPCEESQPKKRSKGNSTSNNGPSMGGQMLVSVKCKDENADDVAASGLLLNYNVPKCCAHLLR